MACSGKQAQLIASHSVELIEQSYIQSSSGYHTSIAYKGKGYLTGLPHRFAASVSSHPAATPLHVIEGQWTEQSKYTTSNNKRLYGQVFADASGDDSASKHEVQVSDITSQGAMESRKVWKDVADGIRASDFDRAGAAKSKLENEQRALRKQEQAEGRTFQLNNFKHIDEDPEYQKLAQLFAFQPASEDSYAFIEGSAPTR